jgi:PDZ domain
MKSTLILTPAAGLALAALGWAAQAWLPLGQIRLKPLQHDAPGLSQGGLPQGGPSQGGAAEIDPEAWKAQLADKDLDLREQAFERAVRAARQQPKLREALEGWARDASSPELAWTSRLLLRESQSAARPLAGAFGVPSSAWGLAGAPQFDFDELFGQMQDLHGNLDQLFGQLEDDQGIPIQPQGGSNSSQSLQLRSGPDGVDCDVTTDVDGQKVTETYHAGSIQELLEQHPELKDKIQTDGLGGGAFSLGFPQAFPGTGSFGWFGPGTSGGRWDVGAPRAPQRTDVLGVLVEPIPADHAADLGLEQGLGLTVQRVEPGTIADVLGVRRGHVLVAIDGHPLKSRDDISAALSARAADAPLSLELIDRWGVRLTRVWSPAEAPAHEEPVPLRPRDSQRF